MATRRKASLARVEEPPPKRQRADDYEAAATTALEGGSRRRDRDDVAGRDDVSEGCGRRQREQSAPPPPPSSSSSSPPYSSDNNNHHRHHEEEQGGDDRLPPESSSGSSSGGSSNSLVPPPVVTSSSRGSSTSAAAALAAVAAPPSAVFSRLGAASTSPRVANVVQDNPFLLDYQDTTTWPSWGERSSSEIGTQIRIFEVLKVDEMAVSVNMGVFLFWTLGSQELLDEALEEARSSVKCTSYYDHHGFEHLRGMEKPEVDAPKLRCPTWCVINSDALEESVVDRDLTVLEGDHGDRWLFQYSKHKVDLIFKLDPYDFPFDEQLVPVKLSLREELGRKFVGIKNMPCVLFPECSNVVLSMWHFGGVAAPGKHENREHKPLMLEATSNNFVGYKCRYVIEFTMRRHPRYYLANYLFVVYATSILSICPWVVESPSAKLEFSAAVVLTIIGIRLTYVQDVGKAFGSTLTWLDIQMLLGFFFIYLMCMIQIISSSSFKRTYNFLNLAATVGIFVVYPIYVRLHIRKCQLQQEERSKNQMARHPKLEGGAAAAAAASGQLLEQQLQLQPGQEEQS